jgi:hypothetical protein
MDPFGAMSAMSAARQSVLSARPDAPVVPERPKREFLTAARTAGARRLHRLADRLEPSRSVVGCA